MNNLSNINERVAYLIEIKANNNKKKFAEMIGFAPQVVSNIVSGRKSKPSFDVLNAIKSSFVDVLSDWLLTGKGEILKSEVELPKIIKDSNGVPLIPIEAMAGWGQGDVAVMDYEAETYKVPEFDKLKVDFMIKVKGSSMYPKYNSGDTVACRKIELGSFFQWNKVYVLDTSQGAMVKRIKKSTQEDHVLCVSDNKSYDPFDLPIEELYSIALVVGVIRLE
ncbi:XRE family transcriptional regulator [Tenacibaculum haliotis]|uniref:XRE family transcriptional regulator n=1 Tax=Tenacibaculum haliotis TaxID=1888914 RepID=UPI0021B04F88|nr:XRE family transcriptional regulator [Tenacibaculum haliotis]MCT4698488.1 hypothetical protein [Tenacibaculum haliotis]